jgi:hypothetical protein
MTLALFALAAYGSSSDDTDTVATGSPSANKAPAAPIPEAPVAPDPAAVGLGDVGNIHDVTRCATTGCYDLGGNGVGLVRRPVGEGNGGTRNRRWKRSRRRSPGGPKNARANTTKGRLPNWCASVRPCAPTRSPCWPNSPTKIVCRIFRARPGQTARSLGLPMGRRRPLRRLTAPCEAGWCDAAGGFATLSSDWVSGCKTTFRTFSE